MPLKIDGDDVVFYFKIKDWKERSKRVSMFTFLFLLPLLIVNLVLLLVK